MTLLPIDAKYKLPQADVSTIPSVMTALGFGDGAVPYARPAAKRRHGAMKRPCPGKAYERAHQSSFGSAANTDQILFGAMTAVLAKVSAPASADKSSLRRKRLCACDRASPLNTRKNMKP